MTSSHYSSRFGDTTLTKVFVGGLAWETPNEELRRHFEQYGEILEAVVITDKATGRSKGYGFVTFREPESARLACADSNPIIDGRRANCNIASQGLSLSSRAGRVHGHGSNYQGAQQYHRIQQPPPPTPLYSPYGYMTYMGDYGYQQQALYNNNNNNHPQLASRYQQHMYGPTSPSKMGLPYPYGLNWYSTMGFPLVQHMPRMQGPIPPSPPPQPPSYVQYPAGQSSGDASFIPSSSLSTSHQQVFQLQDPPAKRKTQQESQQASRQQKSTSGDASGKSSGEN